MKVLLINDATAASNWGGRAAAISLREMILASGARIAHTISEHGIFATRLLEYAAEPDSRKESKIREVARALLPPLAVRVRREMLERLQIHRRRGLIPERWEDFGNCAQEVVGDKSPWTELLNAVDDVDMAIVHGEGSMVGNGIQPRTLLFLSYLIKKHLGKPVIIVNHTADFAHPILRRIAEEVYPLFDDVVFRDPISVEQCKTLCDGRFAPDTGFWFKPASPENWTPVANRLTYFDVWPDKARLDPSEPYLCLGGSSLYGNLFDNLERADAVARQYTTLVKHLQSLYPGQIVLTVSDLVDQLIFRPIAEQLDLPLIGLATPVQQAVDVLGNADAYIGGRWHPSIFALRGGTPIVSLPGKTFKMRALADMAGLSSATFDTLDLEHETGAIGQQLLFYLEQGNDLRSRLCSWAEVMAESSWDNVAYLGGLQTRTGVTRSAGAYGQ